MRKSTRTRAIAACLLGALGFTVAVLGSWIPSLWGDEAASIMSAERTWESLWGMLGTVDAVHGLYYVVLHLWIDAFGASELAVRFPSSVAIGVAVAGVFVLVDTYGPRRDSDARQGGAPSNRALAITASVICCVLPSLTYAGIETRGFALTAAFATWLMIYCVWLIERREGRFTPWLGFTFLLGVATILFIHTALFFPVFVLLAVCAQAPRATLIRTGVFAAIGCALALPIVWLAYQQREQIAFLSAGTQLQFSKFTIEQWFGNYALAILGWLLVLGFIALSILVYARAQLARLKLTLPREVRGLFRSSSPTAPPLALIALVWFIVPPGLLLLINLVTPQYAMRYTTFVSPGLAVLLALSVWAVAGFLGRSARSRVVIATVLTASIIVAAAPTWYFQRTPHSKNGGTDWNTIAQILEEQAQPGDAVVFDDTSRNSRKLRLGMAMYPDAYVGLNDVLLKTPHQDTTGLWDITTDIGDAGDKLASVDTVWLILSKGMKIEDKQRRLSYLPTIEGFGFVVDEKITHKNSIVYRLVRE